MLYQLWGILWRGLRCRLGEATRVIEVCMRLHNFCIDFGDRRVLRERPGNVAVEADNEEEDRGPVFNEFGCPADGL
eukprot:3516552-Rhodomonas_salina.1